MKKSFIILNLLLLIVSNITYAEPITLLQYPTHIDKPNSILTPGEQTPIVDLDIICKSGYSAVIRNVSEVTKRKVYDNYFIPYSERGTKNGKEISKIDHLIPLAISGGNSITNLWPHFFDVDSGWGVEKKNVIENTLHKLVCKRNITLQEAQTCIVTDWISCYQKYVTNRDVTWYNNVFNGTVPLSNISK